MSNPRKWPQNRGQSPSKGPFKIKQKAKRMKLGKIHVNKVSKHQYR